MNPLAPISAMLLSKVQLEILIVILLTGVTRIASPPPETGVSPGRLPGSQKALK